MNAEVNDVEPVETALNRSQSDRKPTPKKTFSHSSHPSQQQQYNQLETPPPFNRQLGQPLIGGRQPFQQQTSAQAQEQQDYRTVKTKQHITVTYREIMFFALHLLVVNKLIKIALLNLNSTQV